MKLKNNIEPFAVGFLNAEIDDIEYRVASGLLNYAKMHPISIEPQNYFAGEYSGVYDYGFDCSGVRYSIGTGVNVRYDLIEKEIKDFPCYKDELEYIKTEIAKYDMDVVVANTNSHTEKMMTTMRICHGGDWGGHTNPDHKLYMDIGTNGLRDKIEKYRKINKGKDIFYDSLIMALDALDTLAERYGMLARKMSYSATDNDKIILERIANTFTHCPKNPPRDFFEACQMFYLLFTFIGVDSPGRFDQYMIKYYKMSDEDDRRICLDKLWEAFHKTRAWNLCISGSDENWNDQTNELSYAILETARKLKYNTPNLTMRVHRNTPQKLIDEAVETISTGIGMPVLYNDECVCPALEGIGIPKEHSHLYCMNGCNQIDIEGKSHMGLEDGEVCLAKCLELTMFNGVCQYSNELLGKKTGDVTKLKTYEEFYNAYKSQVEYVTDVTTTMANRSQEIMSKIAPNVLFSTIMEGCIERARDFKNKGPLYGHGQILAEGIADTVDSLSAIKYFIYETKKYNMQTLLDALKANFKGYDDLYRDFSKFKKFGNDEKYTDEIARNVVSHFFEYLMTKKTFRGGIYTGGCSPFKRVALFGEKIGALPNGKKKGDAILADSIGAVPGCDKEGITSLINSVLSYDQSIAISGFVLNLKFNKAIFNTEDGRKAFKAIVKTYFENGGQQISPMVVSKDELEDAKIHPERHRNLIVRVGGYSDYFVDLTPELQENIIKRSTI